MPQRQRCALLAGLWPANGAAFAEKPSTDDARRTGQANKFESVERVLTNSQDFRQWSISSDEKLLLIPHHTTCHG